MKSLIAALMLVIFTAGAQSLKWSFPAEGVTGWSTDGRGGLAVVHHKPFIFPQLATVSWINHQGRPLFSWSIHDLGQNLSGSSVRIVRFTRSELAVQVEASYEYAPGTNYLRRFRRDASYTDTVLPIGAQIDAQASALTDNLGFFTRESGTNGIIFRRYSN